MFSAFNLIVKWGIDTIMLIFMKQTDYNMEIWDFRDAEQIWNKVIQLCMNWRLLMR
jgi:hypothetical protein